MKLLFGEELRMNLGRAAAATVVVAAACGWAALPADGATTAPEYAAVGFAHGVSTLMVGRLGGPATTIYRGDSPASVQEITVSPDGRRVAFVDTEGSDSPRIAVINVDGTGHKFLSPNLPDRDLSTPVWSRDSTRIYFGCYDMQRGGYYAAYVVPANGSARMAAIPHGGNTRPESVSADGKRIVFDLVVSGERWQRTGVMGVDGTSRRRVGGPDLWQATWRPKTNTLAVSRVLRDSMDAVTIQIQLLNLSTGHYHALTATQSSGSYGAAYPLAWNSGWLYYLHYDYRNGNQVHPRVFRVRPDGTGRTDVTPRMSGWLGPFSVQGR